jgi:hypothetical protein
MYGPGNQGPYMTKIAQNQGREREKTLVSLSHNLENMIKMWKRDKRLIAQLSWLIFCVK